MSALTVTYGSRGAHYYALNGEAIPQVTKCVGVLDKPNLQIWQAREAATWAADNPDQLERLGREGFIDQARGAANRQRDAASKVGRELHSHAEKLATTGEAPDVPPADLAMVQQAADFLDTLAVDTIASERACWHETFRYAGRFDLIGTLRGAVWLLDFKTGKSGVWPEMALQAAAYRFCTHMQGPEPDSPDEPMPPVAHTGIVWVRPEGWQLVPVRADRDTWQAFLATVPLYAFTEAARERSAFVGAPVASGQALVA